MSILPGSAPPASPFAPSPVHPDARSLYTCPGSGFLKHVHTAPTGTRTDAPRPHRRQLWPAEPIPTCQVSLPRSPRGTALTLADRLFFLFLWFIFPPRLILFLVVSHARQSFRVLYNSWLGHVSFPWGGTGPPGWVQSPETWEDEGHLDPPARTSVCSSRKQLTSPAKGAPLRDPGGECCPTLTSVPGLPHAHFRPGAAPRSLPTRGCMAGSRPGRSPHTQRAAFSGP